MKNEKIPRTAKLARSFGALLAIAISLTIPAHAQTETELYDFSGGNDGGFPHSSLIFDSAGNLYGTTANGGGHNSIFCSGFECGTVFKLSRTSSGNWLETVLYAFTGGTDGANPFGGLISDSAGNLYGAASLGGGTGWGTVFKLAPASGGQWQFSVLHSFTGGQDGGAPLAGLLLDPSGNLYGTTSAGGASGLGTVFRLAPGSGGNWNEAVLHSFAGGADGSGPEAALIRNYAGTLFGTTVSGGTGGYGTVFQLSPSSRGWKKTVLHSFTKGKDGGSPFAGLVQDPGGSLFGTTFIGGDNNAGCTSPGSGCGTVYELYQSGSGWSFSVLHTFTGGSDGGGPLGGLTLASGPRLFGTTNAGGSASGCPASAGCGAVFKLYLVSGTWRETVLHSFSDGSDGGSPQAGLTVDSAGHLYGTATTGGSQFEGWGLVFEIAP